MRLKQLEVKGFKSFAAQTVINFDADVIGIVGPNGSGKSNIVDAVRWVLGEQKGRELRLDKMASVIFNGTKKKKPGKLASVSLTFTNDKELLPTEYNDVTITRMLYRSGDSEYRLNDVQCRLKDIRNLFLDTGIGSNSYAIIALGMVDDILADKDNSRRRMFEQAAGISKYKNRKKEALRKLKNTTEDLDRVEDLLAEISRNLGGLEKQARRARKYRELREKYRELSLLLTGIRVEKLRLDRARVHEELEQAESGYQNLEQQTAQLEAMLAADREKHLDKEKLVGERQRKLNALVGELRGLENDRRLLQQRREFVEQQREQLQRQIDRARTQVQSLLAEVEQREPKLAEQKNLIAHREADRDRTQSALADTRKGHAGLKTRLDESLRRQQKQEKRIYELEKQRAINGSRVDNLNSQIDRHREEMNDRREERERLTTRLSELDADIATQQRKVDALEKTENDRLAAIDHTQREEERLRPQLGKINRRLDARRNELRLTKSMIDSMEGFADSVRYLSNNNDWSATQPPRLFGDLLDVAKNYRPAVENYLEPYLSYYVVDTDKEAAAAIHLLNDKKKGRAGFFVLDKLPPAPAPAGNAVELVTVADRYRSLVDHLLHGVEVSPEGSFRRRGFAVGGGSSGAFAGKRIGRKRNLEKLKGQIEEDEQSAATLDKALAEQRQRLQALRRERNDRELNDARRHLGKLQQQRAGLAARAEGFTDYFEKTEKRNEQLGQQINDLATKNEQIDGELTESRDGIENVRRELNAADAEFKALSEELSAASAAYNEANVAFIQQQNLVQTLEQELTYRKDRRAELDRARAADEVQLRELEKEARGFNEQESTLAKNLATLQADKQSYRATLSTAEKEYMAARASINALEDELRQEGRRRQESQHRVNQMREKLNDLGFKMSSLEERLRIEFQVGLEELSQIEIEEWTGTVPELETKVDRLRGRIGNYGEINPLAVEAFDEMQQRHEDITTQRDDILAAKQTLLGTIKEIEEGATRQFLEAFTRVRAHFKEVFRSLFTEDDTCDLILDDPDDPLESTIDIIARPKGKRPQTISQLSGGEKTLTATALLFALYLLKPAPFCIFDEVDAPLDDANIVKFNRIIKKFSTDSQFIIVTHNKLTMEAVDSIYGVYTTEEGGSGVLPVEFGQLAS